MNSERTGLRDSSGRVVDPSLSRDELVTVVDEENKVTGSARRSVMRAEGLIHRATYILVFNTQGDLFVQERTMTKDIFPGCHDLCTGGVVSAGEEYDASALRELEEEIGVRNVPLDFLFDFYGEYAGQKVWGRAYTCVANGPFVLQPEEVAGGRFYNNDELRHLIDNEQCTPDSVYVFRRFRSMQGSHNDIIKNKGGYHP